MSQALVDDLKAKYPFFELKNKYNVPKSLFLADGEEIVVPANGIVTVASTDLSSFPDLAIFYYQNPKISVLDEYGVLERKSKPANAKLHENDEDDSVPDDNPEILNTPPQSVKPPTSPPIDKSANLASKSGQGPKPSDQ